MTTALICDLLEQHLAAKAAGESPCFCQAVTEVPEVQAELRRREFALADVLDRAHRASIGNA